MARPLGCADARLLQPVHPIGRQIKLLPVPLPGFEEPAVGRVILHETLQEFRTDLIGLLAGYWLPRNEWEMRQDSGTQSAIPCRFSGARIRLGGRKLHVHDPNP